MPRAGYPAPIAALSPAPTSPGGGQGRKTKGAGHSITVMDRPDVECLHEAIAEQAARTPDAVAVVDSTTRLTYSELMARTATIAARLGDRGVGVESTVAVLIDRSTTLLTALVGVLRAGAAYVPIEPGTPVARMRQIIQDAGSAFCLVDNEELATTLRAAGQATVSMPEVQTAYPTPSIPRPAVHGDNLCAVYYTSGSTGKPKGVACTHRGWVNRMEWMQRHHRLLPGEVVLHKTTLTFDDAAVELFWPLMFGGCVAMLGPGLHRDPRAIIDAAIGFRTVHLNFVPSMLEYVIEALTDDDLLKLSALRSVLSSGEALRPDLVARFLARFPGRVRLDNTWGATEVSIDSTCHDCGPEDAVSPAAAVSLGRPIDGNDVYVLDSELEQVPRGQPGDLFLAGIGLARCYLNNPAATAAAFVPDPWNAGDRMYRTGDRGLMRADGALEFLGRDDRQVKIRGVRVELAEVELTMRACPGVSDVAATVWQAAPTDKRIVCFVVPSRDSTVSPAQLSEYAAAHLPVYAVPSRITLLEEFPRLPSGKLNWQALADDSRPEEPSCDRDFQAPGTEPEQAVARIWAEVLGVNRVGARDDFFALGGHSLLAIRATGKMIRAFGVEIPVSLVFDHPTVAAAAQRIEELVLADVAALTDEHALRLSQSQ